MLQIEFKNEIGTIVMGGGAHCCMNITGIDGLGAPGMERNVVRYPNQAGQAFLSQTALPRVITIAGTVNGFQHELTRMVKILHRPGSLYLTFCNKRRKINCVCTDFPDVQRFFQSGINSFALQFTCDNPFFTSFEPVSLPLYERANTPLANGKFTPPWIFTATTSTQTFFVAGDEPAEPRITVRSNMTGTANLSFTNATSGAFIRLTTPVADDDIILVDIYNRRIWKNGTEDITNDISDDTFLYSFVLQPGENEIILENNESMRGTDAYIEYAPLFWEAVR